jgi:predicted transcriptional regulator
LRYTDTVTTRETLHALIDTLPEGSLDDASRTLTELRDDRWAWLQRNFEIDDEPLTDADLVAIERGHEDILAGKLVSNEEVGRMLDELCAKLPGQRELSSSS